MQKVTFPALLPPPLVPQLYSPDTRHEHVSSTLCPRNSNPEGKCGEGIPSKRDGCVLDFVVTTFLYNENVSRGNRPCKFIKFACWGGFLVRWTSGYGVGVEEGECWWWCR